MSIPAPDAVAERLAEALEGELPGPWADRAVTVLAPLVTGLAPARLTAVPDDIPARDGTGHPFEAVAVRTRQHLDRAIDAACHTWADKARAALYAALAETDPARLRTKLAAAIRTCEAWDDDLARRRGL